MAKEFEVAKAVNSLIDLSPMDQQSLLEVIEDYFTFPDGTTDDLMVDSSDFDDEMESEPGRNKNKR